MINSKFDLIPPIVFS